jgi:exosortase/archaeosortase family protein
MLSLFLGEMHRFSAFRRTALVGASLVFVLLANLGRTTFLTWAAANRGLHQMEAWHDTAGILVMVIVLLSLFGLAHLMKPKATKVSQNPVGAASSLFTVPCWVAISVLVWIGITEVATEVWYRTHERDLVSNVRWSVAWPTQAAHFKKTAVPEKSLAILRCSNSDSAVWEDAEGNEWSAFFLRWNAGKNSVQLAKGHRPDICFPAAGANLVEDLGQVTVNANGINLPFKHQTFESGSHLLHVFYCLWPDRISRKDKPLIEDSSRSSRLQAVLAGKRNLGQQVLEVVISGPQTSDAAVSLIQQQSLDLIHKE